jgi:hypothetical protein
MARRHLSCPAYLSCPACRIRVRANDPQIALLEDGCPICYATLRAVSSASGVMGFRAFDLDVLSDPESRDRPNPSGEPVDLVSRRKAASARDDLDAHRWSDDGGNSTIEAVARWPRTR